MPISKYTLIGKIVFSICKMESSKLRKIASELSVLSKVRKSKKSKKTKRKGSMKKGSPEAKAWGRKMRRLRNGR